MELNHRAILIMKKLKNDIQAANYILNSKKNPISIAGQLIDDAYSIILDQLRIEHPHYDNRQIMEIIHDQNKIEINLRSLRRTFWIDKTK